MQSFLPKQTLKDLILQDNRILSGIIEAFNVLTIIMKTDEEISESSLYKIVFDCIAFELAEESDWIKSMERLIRSYPKLIYTCSDLVINLYQSLNILYDSPVELTMIVPGLFTDPDGKLLEIAANVAQQKQYGILSYINTNTTIERKIRKLLFGSPETKRILLDLPKEMIFAEYPIENKEALAFPIKIQKEEWLNPNVLLISASTSAWYLDSLSQTHETRPTNIFAKYCWNDGDEYLHSWLANTHRFDEEIFSYLGLGDVREMMRNIR